MGDCLRPGGYGYEWPYTDPDRYNSDWLLAEVKRISAEINSIMANKEEINSKLLSLYNQMILGDAGLRQDLDKLAIAVENDIRNLEYRFESLKTWCINFLNEIQLTVSGYYPNIKAYIDNILREMPDNPKALSPITGTWEPLNEILKQLWDLYTPWQIPAGIYDSIGLTAREYDDMQITAGMYDKYAILLLRCRLNQCRIRSPFDGKMVWTQELIYQLADLHKKYVTAEYYDALNLTAAEYDAKQITASDYDWKGMEVL